MICHMPGTSSLECYCVVLQGGLLMIISRFSSGYIEMFFLWFGGLNNTLAHFTTLLKPQKAWHWSGSDMLCLPLRSSPECPHAASCCVAHVRVSCPSQLRQAKCSVFVESNSDQIVGRHTGKHQQRNIHCVTCASKQKLNACWMFSSPRFALLYKSPKDSRVLSAFSSGKTTL